MEKLVADLSARIKSLEKESIILQKEAQESRAIANRAILECATSSNPAPTPREPKVVFPDKFDGSRRHLRGFLNQLELIFRIQPLTYSSEQLRIATVGTLLSGRALIWYIPMVEYPAGHSYILSSWEGFKKDMINTFGIADQTQESISKIRVLGQGSQPCASISSLSSLNKLLLPGTLRIGPSTFVNTFFVDCGADDLFMDSKLASDLHIPLLKLSTPIKLRLADGDSSSLLTHRTAPLQLHIGKHVETTSFYVTNLCHGIILGYSWLERHNPRINWVSRMVDFDSVYCVENCCVGSSRIQGLGKPPDPTKLFPLANSSESPLTKNKLNSTVDTSSSYLSLKVPEFPQPIGLILPSTNPGTSVVDTTVTIDAMEADSEADILPEHREFDCSIDLKPGVEPSHGKIYQLTREEDTVLQEWISDNLRKGAIRSSSSPHGAPCFFVKQKDKLRLCMDYRGLNQNTVKDRNPIPLISEMLRTLSTGKVFTTLDLRGAYNLLRIRKGDEPKTSFITKYGQFEFLVMPFGLANAPAQFQRMMNSLFREMNGKYVLVYLDDIVIYSSNMAEHKVHVRMSSKCCLTIVSSVGLKSATFTKPRSNTWDTSSHRLVSAWIHPRLKLCKNGQPQEKCVTSKCSWVSPTFTVRSFMTTQT
ncbi:hypothetical protein BASA81_017065 [Batrachochytrium salamandrivorans]|nr:hypothetical protein BASA81_017065 [Batrachochytrium salamandrivorans]